jgi:hypothetical protein
VTTPVEVEVLSLEGRLRLDDRNSHQFGRFLADNAEVFTRYFGARLFNGLLNAYVPEPPSLSADLDSQKISPSIIIPKNALRGNVRGDGQGWPCTLRSSKVRHGSPVGSFAGWDRRWTPAFLRSLRSKSW